MFVRKRGDTKVATIEREYGLDLNARDDMLLRSLLAKRGFASLSQLLQACRGELRHHARRRRVFLSFHYEDRPQIAGLRLMVSNRNVALDLYDEGLRVAINSENSTYVKRAIREKIAASEVVLCLIGNGTAWRHWVDWELKTGYQLRKGLCGVRLKGARGRTPSILETLGAPVAPWGVSNIVAAIECAAARRS